MHYNLISAIIVTIPGLLVSCGQTQFHTEGKGLGYGHTATCRPAPCHMIPEVCD